MARHTSPEAADIMDYYRNRQPEMPPDMLPTPEEFNFAVRIKSRVERMKEGLATMPVSEGDMDRFQKIEKKMNAAIAWSNQWR